MESLDSSADSLTIASNSGLSYKTEKQQKAQSPRLPGTRDGKVLTTKQRLHIITHAQKAVRSGTFSKPKTPYNCKILSGSHENSSPWHLPKASVFTGDSGYKSMSLTLCSSQSAGRKFWWSIVNTRMLPRHHTLETLSTGPNQNNTLHQSTFPLQVSWSCIAAAVVFGL